MIDKLSFTFGVLCICGSEWLTLRHADWFPLYYSVIMTCLLLWSLEVSSSAGSLGIKYRPKLCQRKWRSLTA